MSIMKDYEDLSKTKLMSREEALGKEAHEHLLEIEGKHNELRRRRDERKIKMICIYCGVVKIDEPARFTVEHQCDKPQIFEYKKRPCPSRPKQVKFFEVVYGGKIYRLKHYNAAMYFRNQLWIQKKPIEEVLKDTQVRWFR